MLVAEKGTKENTNVMQIKKKNKVLNKDKTSKSAKGIVAPI